MPLGAPLLLAVPVLATEAAPAAARASLGAPTLEHTRIAVLQNRGALEVFGDPLLAAEAAEKWRRATLMKVQLMRE